MKVKAKNLKVGDVLNHNGKRIAEVNHDGRVVRIVLEDGTRIGYMDNARLFLKAA